MDATRPVDPRLNVTARQSLGDLKRWGQIVPPVEPQANSMCRPSAKVEGTRIPLTASSKHTAQGRAIYVVGSYLSFASSPVLPSSERLPNACAAATTLSNLKPEPLRFPRTPNQQTPDKQGAQPSKNR